MSAEPSSARYEMDVDADGEVDAEGEADQPESRTTPAVSTPAPSTDAQRSQAASQTASQHIQNLIAMRAPVFEFGADKTQVDPTTLSSLTSVPIPEDSQPLSFVNLFPDLPMYSDFLISNDPQSEKRFEESSAWSGRINQISHWLEAKPLLVSTIQPGSTKTRDGWDSAAGALLDDTREGHDQREVPPASSGKLFRSLPFLVDPGSVLIQAFSSFRWWQAIEGISRSGGAVETSLCRCRPPRSCHIASLDVGRGSIHSQTSTPVRESLESHGRDLQHAQVTTHARLPPSMGCFRPLGQARRSRKQEGSC